MKQENKEKYITTAALVHKGKEIQIIYIADDKEISDFYKNEFVNNRESIMSGGKSYSFEPTTINVPTSHNWVTPTDTFNMSSASDEELKEVIKRNSEKNLADFDSNDGLTVHNWTEEEVEFSEYLSDLQDELDKALTFWWKTRKEGFEKFKEEAADLVKTQGSYGEIRPLYSEPQKEITFTEIPDSEFILPAEIVKSKSKKKK